MLPVYEIERDLIAALRAGNRAVLTAPTGSGKTTQVPQMLLRSGMPETIRGEIVVLQPRRLATRLVAARVAAEMDVRLGEEVGYQTRHDSRVSPRTRIRFLTEGLFLRILLADPALEGVGAVVLDEFHERSLAADTSLALVKALQENRRPDLRLIVMSATLDAAAVAGCLACPSLIAGGRMFPVAVHYLEKWTQAPPWELAADALHAVLVDPGGGGGGDVLIFMPGAYEIRRTIESCRRVAGPEVDIVPLHGELPPEAQDAALRPGGRRKVIVSTNVAQTSITIEGIRCVIDSGLARVNRFDARRGINVLLVEPISQAAAEQRAGRAGRTAPGVCFRLWTPAEQRNRPAHDTPEVRRLDLAEVVLQLSSFGVQDPLAFAWLEAPAPLAVERAQGVLRDLGALTDAGALTETGRTLASLPMHPRVGRLLVEASRRGCLERATLWAALLSDRDILTRPPSRELASGAEEGGRRTDFAVLERAYALAERCGFDPARCAADGINAHACREVSRTRKLFGDVCADAGLTGARGSEGAGGDLDDLLKSSLAAFPDHVAVRRSEGNLACALVRGRRGTLDPASVARPPGPLLAVEIREVGAAGAAVRGSPGGVKTVLSLASEIESDWLRDLFPRRVGVERVTAWNETLHAVEELERRVFDDLVLEETARPATDLSAAAQLLAELTLRGLRNQPGGIRLEGWDDQAEAWIARTRSVAAWFPEKRLLAYTDEDLLVILQEVCAGATRYGQVKDRPCLEAVRSALSWEDRRFVERMAPDRIELPRGWRMKLEYSPGQPPRGRAKIQDLFGLERSPSVAGGRVRVLLEILGPNFRPLQSTEDLAGFWKNLYPSVKKELARKYPRHEWR